MPKTGSPTEYECPNGFDDLWNSGLMCVTGPKFELLHKNIIYSYRPVTEWPIQSSSVFCIFFSFSLHFFLHLFFKLKSNHFPTVSEEIQSNENQVFYLLIWFRHFPFTTHFPLIGKTNRCCDFITCVFVVIYNTQRLAENQNKPKSKLRFRKENEKIKRKLNTLSGK